MSTSWWMRWITVGLGVTIIIAITSPWWYGALAIALYLTAAGIIAKEFAARIRAGHERARKEALTARDWMGNPATESPHEPKVHSSPETMR